MSSFEPIVLIYGSPQSVASASLRLPVSSLFAFDIQSFENLVNTPSQLTNPCLHRYFIILLQSIDQDLRLSLQSNHRVISIYDGEKILTNSDQDGINRMINSFRQIILDLTNDIIRFLISEGQKQVKLERLSLVKVYYQQARVLKEWSMTLFKAEPCHILLISLNSSKENMDNAQHRLEQICQSLGYDSTVIRQLNAYIPLDDIHSSVLPYSQLLFNHEDPNLICQLLKNLCSIRLYLYGNELSELNVWSKLLIDSEDEMMNDEDNWSSFIQNESINNEVMWNFAFLFGQKWKTSRVSPIDLAQMKNNPRFSSALHRSHLTYSQRQIDVTAQLFDWYNKCVANEHILIEPKLSQTEESMKFNRYGVNADFRLKGRHPFRHLSLFDYQRFAPIKLPLISFIWLDEILTDCESKFTELIQPFQWNFFQEINSCISFIEKQLREQRYVFFVVSGSIGNELFYSGLCLFQQIYASYIYCAQLQTHLKWTKKYPKIRGVFNESKKLAELIENDFHALNITNNHWNFQSITTDQMEIREKIEDSSSIPPLPITVYDPDQPQGFLSHQRTIDTLLCMPHDDQSKAEMIEGFRRIYQGNEFILRQIEDFQINYHSNGSVQWYTKDSFICRTINQILRSSDVDLMIQFRYILTDLYSHLYRSFKDSHSLFYPCRSETFYRGQIMSHKEFHSFKENQGKIIAINTFLSTTTSMQIAMMYAGQYFDNTDLISVVFIIERDSIVNTRPYANISRYSLFPDEDEVLFSMGSLFRIGNITLMPDPDHIWIIHLKMTDQNDYRFKDTNLHN